MDMMEKLRIAMYASQLMRLVADLEQTTDPQTSQAGNMLFAREIFIRQTELARSKEHLPSLKRNLCDILDAVKDAVNEVQEKDLFVAKEEDLIKEVEKQTGLDRQDPSFDAHLTAKLRQEFNESEKTEAEEMDYPSE